MLLRGARNHRNGVPGTMTHRRKTDFFPIQFPIQNGAIFDPCLQSYGHFRWCYDSSHLQFSDSIIQKPRLSFVDESLPAPGW